MLKAPIGSRFQTFGWQVCVDRLSGVDQFENFWLRPYIMGRSVQMNEALIFIAIMIATILEGIMGALLIVLC